MFKLPTCANNPVEITIQSSQINKQTDNLDKRVFRKNTFSIIYGSRFTGKSILLSNLIEKFYLGKNGFKQNLILTPSLNDKAWNNILHQKKVKIFKISRTSGVPREKNFNGTQLIDIIIIIFTI